MKKMKALLILFALFSTLTSCFNSQKKGVENEAQAVADTVAVYSEMQDKQHCFIVISKQELKLYVCEALDDDTVRIAGFPVCLGKVVGQKQRVGDMRTPESTWSQPFSITEIVDASGWCHDFKDGRGSILAYGNWFMRLKTPGFTGIGIHGSTNNEDSVPGRASEGCIRLRNADLDLLKEQYAYKGMSVVIKGENECLKPFEEKYY